MAQTWDGMGMQRLCGALRALVCSACFLMLGTVARAQPIGRLAGVVHDSTGSVLPGVSLTISGAALTTPRTVVTDEHGKYVLEKLSRGRYSLTAALRGFEPWSMDLSIVDGGPTKLDVMLLVRTCWRTWRSIRERSSRKDGCSTMSGSPRRSASRH